MPRRSFQDPALKQTVLANPDSKEREGICILLFPDGTLILEPAGTPTKGGINGIVSLTPQQALALQRFFNGSRVQDRLADMSRRNLMRNPHTRELVQWMDKMFDEHEAAA